MKVEDIFMDVSYNKFFKMLIDRGIKKMEFTKISGISANTMARMSKNETVSLDVLIKICRSLDCTIDDLLEILPNEK